MALKAQTQRLEKALEIEKTELQMALKGIDLKTQNALKNNRKVAYSPNKPSQFQEKDSKFETVEGKHLESASAEKRKQRVEQLQHEKEELETKQCTFHPKINEKSQELSQSGRTDEEFHKRLYQVKKHQPVAAAPEPEQPEGDLNARQNRPHNPNFYEEQVQWKKAKEDKKLAERLKQAEETTKLCEKPHTNKATNERLLGVIEEFGTRVQTNLEDSKRHKEQLAEEVYNHSFKPKTNKKKDVKSMVYEQPRPKLA